MSITKNTNLVNIIQAAIKATLGGALTMVIGFIGSVLAIVLLFVLDLKLWWKKMELKKWVQRYIIKKR